MRRAQRTDFFREIARTKGRFISLFFIVALGCAFYSGIRSAEPDMMLSGDKYYDETRFMDARVLGTLGLTDGDVRAIEEAAPGAIVEPGYETEVLGVCGEDRPIIRVFSVGESLNRLSVREGRTPEGTDECFLDSAMADKYGYTVGDKLQITTEEGERPEELKSDTFEIVGTGTFSWYLTFDRGQASIGDGSLDAFLAVDASDFDMEVYTVIYAGMNELYEMDSFSEGYEDAVEKLLTGPIEAIEDERCQIRYDDIYAEAREELDDARGEIADAKKEIEDGRREIEDGRQKIADAKREIEDARDELAGAAQELDYAGEEIERGERELADNQRELEAQRLAAEEEINAALFALPEGYPVPEELVMRQAAAQATFDEAQSRLDAARESLKSARAELERGRKEYEGEKADAEAKIADAEREIEEHEWDIADAEKEIADAEADIAEGEEEIADGERELSELEKPEWFVLDRGSVESAVTYHDDAERIGSLGTVFPAIFFLVAALVSLTTMTRMIEEERIHIGTMKALGYPPLSIASRYILYAFIATIGGGAAGVLVGSKILPFVIMSAYGMLYVNMPYMELPYDLRLCALSVGVALFATVGAALVGSFRELASVPAALMRPPVPGKGRKLLLERIPAIWRRLTFNTKLTIRNLLRYKKRLFMTVFGIGGCMSVLLVSVGLHDSIQAIVDNQYKNIWTYTVSAGIDGTKDNADKEELRDEALAGYDDIDDAMLARNFSIDALSADEKRTKSAYLYVVEDVERSEKFVSLHDRETGQSYALTDEGVVMSEKTAGMLGLSAGDKVKLKPDDHTVKETVVTALCENYMYHYIYMTPALYEKLFDEEPEWNELYLKMDDSAGEEAERAVAAALLKDDSVSSVRLVRDLQDTVADMLHALDLVVWVLVAAAGLLVFVVTWNLNNINISERRRELASLLVLGMTDREVAMVIYRENIILTFFGIIAGLFMGTALHRYVILTLEVEYIMFGREISLIGYIEASVLTAVFSVAVNLLMYWRIKDIDMVESLKSIE